MIVTSGYDVYECNFENMTITNIFRIENSQTIMSVHTTSESIFIETNVGSFRRYNRNDNSSFSDYNIQYP